ncbi:folate-binding protein [Roseibacterium sp. SDUM158016]|uniref:CAF17-like 4Fe-4S cluster assembly/insertion protein YgfZ n=1 Tax=Roseicyclus sediminis TaxID=2980997 RepID=UPI0021D20106|nr:folate-binding protein [Roseibacterium sp. SDUM158016]MCU4653217.1 folate-binding protein [Roseibacterium sp. SDUM158016]
MTEEATGERASDRTVLRISGGDREKFLHGLVTHDVGPEGSGLVWSALLTPQGKYLADFFLLNRGEDILLDVKTELAAGLAQRLSMYRLRADVGIEDSGLTVTRGLGDAPEGAWPDPRHPALGWRGYGLGGGEPAIDWDAIRVAACVPETGVELVPNDSFILEMGFDRLHGVDHRKGCYVGQEVTARMKHKTELRKGLVTVTVTGRADPGTPIEDAEGRTVGTLFTQAGGMAIAYLRFDRAGDEMRAGEARIGWQP